MPQLRHQGRAPVLGGSIGTADLCWRVPIERASSGGIPDIPDIPDMPETRPLYGEASREEIDRGSPAWDSEFLRLRWAAAEAITQS
ncbi:hypothetical protein [Actinokineospora diospyrosa]|uniref:Uncharacterized protein n=1 Tax=Actinokineospora diospyrosa TaxID=103728 RepID=A0ABT1ICG6_9PSEU|nr:hypothetical protein [Actinokineospora diospyrosa]MCP2270259.1 hypothetical protein [Actinokineospora diospyrosa]